MDTLLFGTGGTPLSAAGRSSFEGVERIAELGLGAMEIEFVHGARMKAEEAQRVGSMAKAKEILLSAHGPYYVNLASLEPPKIEASHHYLLNTARACHHLGAKWFTFHSAFYQKQDKEVVYGLVKTALLKLKQSMHDEGIDDVMIRPELTGKATQFGDLDELIRLSQEVVGVLPCIDFAHAHARTGGKNNTAEEFGAIMTALEKGLGRAMLDHMYIHMSGIAYSDKGEQHHLVLEESDLKWREILDVLREFDVKGEVVCESPNLEEDALLMQKYYKVLE